MELQSQHPILKQSSNTRYSNIGIPHKHYAYFKNDQTHINMLRDTNLKVLPSTSGSIQWSADGQLCISLGDRVNIFSNTCFNPQNVHPKMIFNNINSKIDEDGENELEEEEDDQNDNESIVSDKSEDDDDLDVVSFDTQFFLTTIDINIVPESGVELLDSM